MSAVAQPDEEAPYPVRMAFQCGGNRNTEKPNHECGTPRASLSISARIQKPQSACPLIRRHESESNGTKQDKPADRRADLSLARSTARRDKPSREGTL